MDNKSPWAAAILNFLLPGLGFVYCGTDLFVLGGGVMIVFSLLESIVLFASPVPPVVWFFSLGGAFAWGILGYGAADYINKMSIHPPSPTQPLLPPPQLMTAPPMPSAPSSTKVFCIYCGMENPPDASFCKKCGKGIVK